MVQKFAEKQFPMCFPPFSLTFPHVSSSFVLVFSGVSYVCPGVSPCFLFQVSQLFLSKVYADQIRLSLKDASDNANTNSDISLLFSRYLRVQSEQWKHQNNV